MPSDTKAKVLARKDARNTKKPEGQRPATANSKDTKRWCRGVVGREHDTKCFKYKHADWKDHGWRDLVCVKCGKRLAYYWPSTWSGAVKTTPPEWVTE